MITMPAMMIRPEPMVYLAEQGLGNIPCAVKSLHCLQATVHSALVITYYRLSSISGLPLGFRLKKCSLQLPAVPLLVGSRSA